jgi:dolichyl-phosphate-mannose-protein mannosyltransferase
VTGITYKLSLRRSYALLAGLLIAFDGLLLVESRYALLNVYLLIFGLLGQFFFLTALDKPSRQRKFWLMLSGIGFGASMSVKWYGLGFLLGIWLFWLFSRLLKVIFAFHLLTGNSLSNLLKKFSQIKFSQMILGLGIIPAVVYCLLWIPHLQIDPTLKFWELHQQILAYHLNLGSGIKEHPYCSQWYTWPWLIRPIGYLFKQTKTTTGEIRFYDIHGMGNPFLWWLSSIAILMLLLVLIIKIRSSLIHPIIKNEKNNEFGIILYLLLNYAANFLPWMKVSRCSFLYYYMGASIFAFMALAWIVERSLRSHNRWYRALGTTIIFLVLFSFVFWLPIYLGLPLSPEAFYRRMWLPSWI